ncbi:NAD(P)-binding protein [Mycena kentingensis (nom. inval.)]|nr:NAD(P)-binding protein [Mycena kentingensis (nom. inval.)]
MGDTLCSGFLYLCGCCCFSSTDPGPDGSGFCSGRGGKITKDPREVALKKEFMARDYRRDAATGRIVTEQPPGPVMQMVGASTMLPSDEKGSRLDVDKRCGRIAAPPTRFCRLSDMQYVLHMYSTLPHPHPAPLTPPDLDRTASRLSAFGPSDFANLVQRIRLASVLFSEVIGNRRWLRCVRYKLGFRQFIPAAPTMRVIITTIRDERVLHTPAVDALWQQSAYSQPAPTAGNGVRVGPECETRAPPCLKTTPFMFWTHSNLTALMSAPFSQIALPMLPGLGTDAQQQQQQEQRMRASMACLACRTRKTKCVPCPSPPSPTPGRVSPSYATATRCARCTQRGLVCEWVAPVGLSAPRSAGAASKSRTPSPAELPIAMPTQYLAGYSGLDYTHTHANANASPSQRRAAFSPPLPYTAPPPPGFVPRYSPGAGSAGTDGGYPPLALGDGPSSADAWRARGQLQDGWSWDGGYAYSDEQFVTSGSGSDSNVDPSYLHAYPGFWPPDQEEGRTAGAGLGRRGSAGF